MLKSVAEEFRMLLYVLPNDLKCQSIIFHVKSHDTYKSYTRKTLVIQICMVLSITRRRKCRSVSVYVHIYAYIAAHEQFQQFFMALAIAMT